MVCMKILKCGSRAVIASAILLIPASSRAVDTPAVKPAGVDESANWSRYRFREVHMGVDFTLQLYARDRAHANASATAAFARVRELNRICSDYDPNSELMTLCATAKPEQPMPVSATLATVLALSQQTARQTRGAFDITVGPAVKLWRSARRAGKLPPAERIQQSLKSVGHQLLKIDESQRTATLLQAGMQLDLGGIAKGYAGDEMLRVLREFGITRAMVDASGDIVAADPPPGLPGWKIALAPLNPLQAQPVNSQFVCLQNAAIATSGDAFQHIEIDGVRYSHIVNPRTGIGLTQRSSVTVIARTGATADALASAVSVLGPKRGLRFVNRTPNVEARIVFPRKARQNPDAGPSAVLQRRSRGFHSYAYPAVAESAP